MTFPPNIPHVQYVHAQSMVQNTANDIIHITGNNHNIQLNNRTSIHIYSETQAPLPVVGNLAALRRKVGEIFTLPSASTTSDVGIGGPQPVPIEKPSKTRNSVKSNQWKLSDTEELLELVNPHVDNENASEVMKFCFMDQFNNEAHGIPLPSPSQILVGEIGVFSPAGFTRLGKITSEGTGIWKLRKKALELEISAAHSLTPTVNKIADSPADEPEDYVLSFDGLSEKQNKPFIYVKGDIVRKEF